MRAADSLAQSLPSVPDKHSADELKKSAANKAATPKSSVSVTAPTTKPAPANGTEGPPAPGLAKTTFNLTTAGGATGPKKPVQAPLITAPGHAPARSHAGSNIPHSNSAAH